MRCLRIGLLAAAMASFHPGSPAIAADERAEEIVITAERRESSLQSTPLSITALSGAALDRSGVEDTAELPMVTPGLVFTTNSVFGQPYIRGVGSDLITAGADPAVAVLVDDVYQARSVAAVQDFFDVDRVEIVKGPQGTLLGRNTTGGAIRIFTRDPTAEFGADADLLFGNYDQLRVRGFVNIPVVDDRVMLRISGLRSQRNGFSENLFLGRDLDDADVWATRGKLLLVATDQLEILVSGDFSHDHSTRFLAPKVSPPLTGSPAYLAGGTVPADPRDVLFDTQPFVDAEAWGTSSKIAWHSNSLAFDSITAFRKTDFRERLDLDATEISFLTNAPHERSESLTQEFQLRSRNPGAFDWVTGAYYQREWVSQSLDVQVVPASIRDQPNADLTTDAFAVFGEASYAFLERWRFAAGVRYSYEKKRENYVETVNGAIVASFKPKDHWDAWTPRFVLEYQPVDMIMLYATVARGFRSGGYNTTVAQPYPFDPEYLWSYEAGVRWSLWGDRGHLHIAGFYGDYDDMQLQVVSPNSAVPYPLVENAGSATIWGVESEWFLRPFEGFELDGALAFLDTRIDNLVAVNPNSPVPEFDQSGNRLPKAPRFSAWVGAAYSLPFLFGTLTARVDYKYQSRIYFDVFQDHFASQSSYGLVGARLSFAVADSGWVLSVWGENLSDELYAQSNIRLDGSLGNLFFWGMPRTYGLQVAFHY